MTRELRWDAACIASETAVLVAQIHAS